MCIYLKNQRVISGYIKFKYTYHIYTLIGCGTIDVV